mmetsp:Transcript_24541/g.79231  ORF Transcript_24541/g.79231 Transcript_24541/m.79231 type:complete len:259 (-) Transcript_24541:1178-1954(-)
MAAPHFLTTLRGRPQMRSPMMSPSRSSGSGLRRNRASRSTKSTWKPASSTRSPKRCLSPMTDSLVMVVVPNATRGSSSPGALVNRPRMSPSFLSMATSTKLRRPSARVACAQLMARSTKSPVAKSRMTVLLSHAASAARRITPSSCSGSSSEGPAGTNCAPDASALPSATPPPPPPPSPSAPVAASPAPSVCSAPPPCMRMSLQPSPLIFAHQSLSTSSSEGFASSGCIAPNNAALSTGPPLPAHCRTSRVVSERLSR